MVSGSFYGAEASTWYVRVVANITDADQWSYTVTLTETNAPPPVECIDSDTTDDEDFSDARFEPNNSFATAYELALNLMSRSFIHSRLATT